MADLPTALAQLVIALLEPNPSQPVPRDALLAVADALEHLSTDPAAAEQLREQIAEARRNGQVQINFVPLCLLQFPLSTNDQGGQDDE